MAGGYRRRGAVTSLPDREWMFQSKVTEAAERCGWHWHHEVDSRKSKSGFPDLVLVRERVIFAELKIPPNKPTVAQEDWYEKLKRAGAEVYVWRPLDFDDILRVLAHRSYAHVRSDSPQHPLEGM